MANSRTIRLRELRGNILNFLREIYPETVTKNSILATYYEYYDVDDIEAAIAYLKEKDLLAEKKLDSPFTKAFQVSFSYRITADGIDILDGTTEDAGIIIPRV